MVGLNEVGVPELIEAVKRAMDAYEFWKSMLSYVPPDLEDRMVILQKVYEGVTKAGDHAKAKS